MVYETNNKLRESSTVYTDAHPTEDQIDKKRYFFGGFIHND